MRTTGLRCVYSERITSLPSPFGSAKMVFVDLAMDNERCDAAYDALIKGKR